MKIGLLADTHSNKADGSDLPDAVLKAFKGCDAIVHLGDIGRKAILDRLGEVAPVWVPSDDRKGYWPAGGGAIVKLLADGDAKVGLTFNLAQPDKKITVTDDGITFAAPMDELLEKRFKDDVAVVAFAATHVAHTSAHDGVLFVNPGSPTLPSDGPKGSVALLDLGPKPKAKIVRL